MYRAGLALQLVASLTTILLAGAFFVLLQPAAPNWALMALLWRTAEATLGGVAAVISFIALDHLRTGAEALGQSEFVWLARLLSHSYATVFHVTLIYFSQGSSLFFWLLLRARYILRALAVFGLFASSLVVMLSFIQL